MSVGKLQLIEEAQDNVNKLAFRVANSKAEFEAVKKLHDQAVKRRDQVIAIGEAALKDQHPLFPEEENGKPKTAGAGKEKKPTKAQVNAAAVADSVKTDAKAWRAVPIKDVITIGSIRNYLETDGITELGPMIDKLGKGWNFKDCPGVGPEKAARAADQLASYRKAHPEWVF